MKKAALIVMAWSIISPLVHAEIVCSWDFNSNPPDDATRTGTLAPVLGTGTAEPVGEISGTFASGSASDPGPDNSGWNTASYPAQGTGNKSAGVQFNVSTVGYRDITVAFEQRVTGTASRYARLQYTANGTDFVDGPVIELSTASSFVPQNLSLATIIEANNNPNFAIRIVTEFESTATGQGAEEYVTTSGSSYSSSGTIRFDLVTITGEPIGSGNTPPTISAIADQMTLENEPVTGLAFVVQDAETSPDALVVEGSSSDTQLVPPDNIVLGGSGSERTITITPMSGQTGQVTITVTVSDGNLTAAQSFLVTVLPLVHLQIAAEGNDIEVGWPLEADGYRLESSDSLFPPVWEAVPDEPGLDGERYVLRFDGVSGIRFFRLRNPNLPAPGTLREAQ